MWQKSKCHFGVTLITFFSHGLLTNQCCFNFEILQAIVSISESDIGTDRTNRIGGGRTQFKRFNVFTK